MVLEYRAAEDGFEVRLEGTDSWIFFGRCDQDQTSSHILLWFIISRQLTGSVWCDFIQAWLGNDKKIEGWARAINQRIGGQVVRYIPSADPECKAFEHWGCLEVMFQALEWAENGPNRRRALQESIPKLRVDVAATKKSLAEMENKLLRQEAELRQLGPLTSKAAR